MPTKRRAVAAGAAALAVVGGTALAAVAAEPSQTAPTTEARYHVDIPADATDAQREALAAMVDDSPIPVQDQEGVQQGYVRDSALTERDARVNEQILGGFREYDGGEDGTDPEYDELYEALRVLDPVPVVDGEGETVGYFTHNFQTAAQIEAATPAAQALVDDKIG